MELNFSLLSKFQLRDIIKNLQENSSIGAREKFLQEYDNGNSIWDKEEIQLIKNDYNNGKFDNTYQYVEEKPIIDGDLSEECFREEVLKLSTQSQKQAKQLLDINLSTERLSRDDILELAELPPEEFETAKQYLYIKERGNEQFDTIDLCFLAKIPQEKAELVKQLVFIKNREDEQFDGEEIKKLTELTKEQLEIAKKYFYLEAREDTEQFSADEICYIAKLSPENLKEFEKITNGKNNFNVQSNEDGEVEVIFKDTDTNELVLISIPKKLEQKLKYDVLDDMEYTTSETFTQYDKDGNVKLIQNITPSEIDGFSNITVTENGETKTLQKAYSDPNTKENVVVKNYTSKNGTTTSSEYRQDKDGNYSISYIIRDCDGKELLNRQQSFKKTSESQTITTINGKTYVADFSEDFVTIHCQANNKSYRLDINKLLGANQTDEFRQQTIKMIKNMPANLLIKMTDERCKINESLNAVCSPDGTITMPGDMFGYNNEETILPTFIHEFGHFIDLDSNGDFSVISGNEKIISTFNRELEAFRKNSSYLQQHDIAHLTDDGLTEMVAEINMLANGSFSKVFNNRDLALQQHFPETFSLIVQLLDKELASDYT